VHKAQAQSFKTSQIQELKGKNAHDSLAALLTSLDRPGRNGSARPLATS